MNTLGLRNCHVKLMPQWLAAAMCAVLGCASDDDREVSGQSTKDMPPSAAVTLAPLKVSITVPDVEPGVEGTRCVKVRLGNTEPVHIGRIHNKLAGFSHHFVLSAVEDPEQTEQELYECPPFRAPLVGAPLTVTQKHDEEIRLPKGVGYALEPNQLMHLELHYINTGSDKADVTAEAELFALPTAEDIQPAGFLVVGNLNIDIPPRSQHSTGDVFVAQPSVLESAHYYAFTGHTHRFGTGVRVGYGASAREEPTWVYQPESFDWESPPVTYLEPELQIPAGGGFRFRCDWNNTTDETLKYGESALTEMCFFWAYYYPRNPEQQVILAGLEDSMYAKDGAKQAP